LQKRLKWGKKGGQGLQQRSGKRMDMLAAYQELVGSENDSGVQALLVVSKPPKGGGRGERGPDCEECSVVGSEFL